VKAKTVGELSDLNGPHFVADATWDVKTKVLDVHDSPRVGVVAQPLGDLGKRAAEARE
jgi:hypothetical protein